MGRRKDIKVVCLKDYTMWVSAEHLIKSGIKPEEERGTQNFKKFEKDKIYKCSEIFTSIGDSTFVYVDSHILHAIGGKGTDYPKFLYEGFYINQNNGVIDTRRQFVDYFEYLK